MEIKDLLRSATFSRIPKHFQQHKVFQKIKRIRKPFSSIGLGTSLEKCDFFLKDGKQYYIGFSAENVKGFWDIATMSMRGVSSCMHWENEHSSHLIGSITDPFLGMVYITDNTLTKYGLRFIRRSLVRFMVDELDVNPYKLFIERPYADTGNINPFIYRNRDPDHTHTMHIFKEFLRGKVQNNYHVVNYADSGRCGHIPYSTSIRYIKYSERSMSDNGCNYTIISNNDFIKQFSDQD